MNPSTILKLHRVALEELHVDFFEPLMSDVNAWRDFLGVMASLDDTPGGPLTPADVRAVIRWMRAENAKGNGKWALRLTRILRDPETFRDLVLERRRKLRTRPARVEEAKRVIETRDGKIAQLQPVPQELAASDGITATARKVMDDFKRSLFLPTNNLKGTR